VPDKNQPHATEVVFGENGWEGTNGPLHAEDAAVLNQIQRHRLDNAISRLAAAPAPERAENMADFMSNLETAKASLKAIRMLTAMRAAFGSDPA
jgi:hypothetical protein